MELESLTIVLAAKVITSALLMDIPSLGFVACEGVDSSTFTAVSIILEGELRLLPCEWVWVMDIWVMGLLELLILRLVLLVSWPVRYS